MFGVPETYIIDKAGVIRFKYIGPLTMNILNQKIYPVLSELKKS
jgi:cytochrome c biogenesis protein CcmG/thiol:disulfide interchange protein DsbE